MAKISKTYKPTQKEKFMNAKMKEYFRQKLENWKNELLKESSQTLNNLQTENEANAFKMHHSCVRDSSLFDQHGVLVPRCSGT